MLMASHSSTDLDADGVIDDTYTSTFDSDGNLISQQEDNDADGTADSIVNYSYIATTWSGAINSIFN